MSGEKVVSLSQFYEIWRSHFAEVKIPKVSCCPFTEGGAFQQSVSCSGLDCTDRFDKIADRVEKKKKYNSLLFLMGFVFNCFLM